MIKLTKSALNGQENVTYALIHYSYTMSILLFSVFSKCFVLHGQANWKNKINTRRRETCKKVIIDDNEIRCYKLTHWRAKKRKIVKV